jgi:hypothetical protein
MASRTYFVYILTNFTNANFIRVDLTGSVGIDPATRPGITWSNTICPEGTNSNDNGNTCEGHLAHVKIIQPLLQIRRSF